MLKSVQLAKLVLNLIQLEKLVKLAKLVQVGTNARIGAQVGKVGKIGTLDKCASKWIELGNQEANGMTRAELNIIQLSR